MPRQRIKPLNQYVPRGIPRNVCQFFVANPDEELTTADIAIKFDVARQSVAAILGLAEQAGLLSKRMERQEKQGGQGRVICVYSAGPDIKRITKEA
jgi:predicted transcriptional regulator